MRRQFSNGSNYIAPDLRPKAHRPWNEQMRFDAVRVACYNRGIIDTDEVYRIFEAVKRYCLNIPRTEIAVGDYLDAQGVDSGTTTVHGQ